MPETTQPLVLLIGECQSPQFRSALDDHQIGDALEVAQTHSVNLLADAIALVETGELVPDLVVSYQSIPDEYSAEEIDRLIGMLPLSRFVVAFSQWCESIGRTEQRWPSAWSVPLAHASTRIRIELQHLAINQPPLPATTSRDEAFATLAGGCLKNAANIGQGMSAAVVSVDVPIRECFEQILKTVGFETGASGQSHDLYVVVAAFIDENQLRRVTEIRKDDSILLVASDMATPADRSRLLEAGATEVVSQLRFAEDLIDYYSTLV